MKASEIGLPAELDGLGLVWHLSTENIAVGEWVEDGSTFVEYPILLGSFEPLPVSFHDTVLAFDQLGRINEIAVFIRTVLDHWRMSNE
ncbi:MAG: hypothetical protein EKK55_04530 [Rhodocyclaceae bacterium]|nr:MAG: hypothetical protein EKK55_04530 [Rhodocyclaceae bacterium]